MHHEYYYYNKEQLLSSPKIPMEVMADKPTVFQAIAREMADFIKAQNEGITGAGEYTRFAVRQEDPQNGRDFIVVRVFDEEMRKILAGKSDNDRIAVDGTLRSSRGSGVNYVKCGKLE